MNTHEFTSGSARRARPARLRTRRWGSRRLAACLLFVGLGACGDSGTDPNTTPPNGDPDPTPYDHGLAAGASAHDLLSSDDYDRLVVEVQYVSGHRPTDGALQQIQTFLEERLNKPAGITLQLGNPLVIQSQASYTAADVRALEEQHRTQYTEGSTLATYLLFLDGEFSDGQGGGANVLGIAYNNTSMAVFQEKIDQHTGAIGQPTQENVEAIVSKHEFGHIFGLVNNGSAMQTEHQDEPNGRHCDNDMCLMHYSVRLSDFIANLLGDTPDLDQNCLDDLAANGGR